MPDENMPHSHDEDEIGANLRQSQVPYFRDWVPMLLDAHKKLDNIVDQMNLKDIAGLSKEEREIVLRSAAWVDIGHSLVMSLLSILISLDDKSSHWESVYKAISSVCGDDIDIEPAEIIAGIMFSMESAAKKRDVTNVLRKLKLDILFG